jgi:hypothetical protein
MSRDSRNNQVFIYCEEKYVSFRKIRTSMAHVWACGEQLEYAIDLGFNSVGDRGPSLRE